MKKALDILLGSLHAVILSLMIVAVLLAGSLYAIVHTRLASLLIEHSLTELLAEQIGAKVTMEEDAEVSWNNQVVLNKLTIYDQQDEKLIYARRAMVAFELWPLLKNHLTLNTCQLIDFEINAYRETADSPTNYQFLIDALSAKRDPEKQPFIQQLDLNFIVLRQGTLSYEVKDKPQLQDSPIDPYHIKIDKLSANVHMHDKELLIKKFHCMEHENAYRAERVMVALNPDDMLEDAADERPTLLRVDKLEINGEDLKVIADIDGHPDEISARFHQLELPLGHPRLPGIKAVQAQTDIRFYGFDQPIDSLWISADLKDIRLLTEDYGALRIDGALTGTSHEMSLRSAITGQQGALALDAHLLRPSNDHLSLSGSTSTSSLDLAQLFPNQTQLGDAAINLNYNYEQQKGKPARMRIAGTLNRLKWRGNYYHAIGVQCLGNLQHLNGTIALCDSLGDVNADFELSTEGKTHRLSLEGDFAHLSPNGMNLCDVALLNKVSFSGGIQAMLSASGKDDAEADIRVNNLSITKGDKSEKLGTLTFEGNADEGVLASQIANLVYSQKSAEQQTDVRGNVAVVNDLLALLDIPVKMSQRVQFEAKLDSAGQVKRAFLDLPEITINEENQLTATLTAKDSIDGSVLQTLALDIHNAKHRLNGRLQGRLQTDPLVLTLDPTTFDYNDQAILLDGAKMLHTENGDYEFKDIHLKGGVQEISASGIVAHNGDKDFVISLKDFDLGQIFKSLDRGYVHFGGRATGDLVLSNKPEMILTADSLKIQHFEYIDTLLGDASINLTYNLPQDYFEAKCDLVAPTAHKTHIECEVDMHDETKIDLRVHPDHLPLGFINYWTGDILQQFCGTVTGDVRLFGPTSHLQLAGSPTVDGRFTHDILGAYFHLHDRIKLSHNLLYLEHAKIDDEHGHPLTVDAQITHEDLKNFGYLIDINMPDANQGFLVLDRPEKPGRTYWGQIYAQGNAHLAGGNGKHRIDVDFATTDKSWIFVSPFAQDINPDQEAYSFLTFRDKNQLVVGDYSQGAGDNQLISLDIPLADNDSHSDIEVKLIAKATEQCEVTVQMDPSSDDLLTSRGNGTLTIIYNPQRDLTLAGEYRINKGTYTMNVNPDIINKRFQLQNTSSVSFNGVPSEANIHLDATYTIPSVNLSDLGEQVTAMKSLSRTTVPIDCKMNVSGQLAAPQIEFDLEVKNGNKELDDLVHNAIGTPEMINQQVLYLLIFSKFYPPQEVQAQSQMRAGAELSSLASASVASQLNQLLNRLSDNLTLGTNFKSDRGDFTDMEMDLSLSTRLLNDRLLLYGNVGYRDPANRIGMVGNTSSFIGDFDIEYIINSSRTLRAKVYSHYNERDYSINNALTTQGVGLIWHHDFDTFGQIWHRKNWLKKKE